MTISLLLLSLVLAGPTDLRAVNDSTKPQRPAVRPTNPPKAPALKPPAKPTAKPVGEPVLKRRRTPA